MDDLYEFVRQSRGKCYLQKIWINGQYVDKAFCTRCPKCGRGLPGMLSVDGSECCLKCDYQRQVYSAEELTFLGKTRVEQLEDKTK